MALAQPAIDAGNWMAAASKQLRTALKPHAAGEASGPCPACGGKDRFIAFEDGNYWCRRCQLSGWWRLDVTEARREVAARQLQRQKDALQLREVMAGNREWLTYHQTLLNTPAHLGLLAQAGLPEKCVRQFGIGWCPESPLYRQSASITFPVWIDGRLHDIRHRLMTPPDGASRYRSHMAGISPAAYNLDAILDDEMVLVVEGEKKVAILVGVGFRAVVGIPGQTFARAGAAQIAQRMDPLQTAIVGLDPDAMPAAETAVRTLLEYGRRALLADFPLKPDDTALQYGARTVEAVLNQARKLL